MFEDDGDSLINKIVGYHQFHGVRETVRAWLASPKENLAAET